jgi:hypothetical protein
MVEDTVVGRAGKNPDGMTKPEIRMTKEIRAPQSVAPPGFRLRAGLPQRKFPEMSKCRVVARHRKEAGAFPGGRKTKIHMP